jgi:hypothetical protein
MRWFRTESGGGRLSVRCLRHKGMYVQINTLFLITMIGKVRSFRKNSSETKKHHLASVLRLVSQQIDNHNHCFACDRIVSMGRIIVLIGRIFRVPEPTVQMRLVMASLSFTNTPTSLAVPSATADFVPTSLRSWAEVSAVACEHFS